MRTRTFSAGSNRAGYTLIELLVVLTLMAALFTMVPPLFTSTSSANELRAITRQMSTVLRQTRSTAVAARVPAEFILDLEQHRYQLAGHPPVQLPSDLQLTLLTGESELRGHGRGAIRFFADGSSTGGRITVSRGKSARQLDVAWLTGRITSSELLADGAAP